MATPNFESIYPPEDSKMLRDAYQAITDCDLWNWFAIYEPEEDKGFMFGEHPNLTKINNAMKYEGHSGFSYAWTMRVMKDIAKGARN
jgi:hypothetical protein